MPTLFLSDLDGTLLCSDQHTSSFTNKTLNHLIDQGMRFSYATARSYHTASKAAHGLTARFPLIVYNGAFIVDNVTHDLLLTNLFTPEEAHAICADLLDAGCQPIVYCLDSGRERFCYRTDRVNDDTRAFLLTRQGDPRDTPVCTNDELMRGTPFYFTCIGDESLLSPLWEKYRDRCNCVWHRDIYSGARWLELMPQGASKANAARQLAAMLGCERIVAFGDAINDLPLFDAADEAYAVANASDEVKVRATAVISSNDDNGVARWLLEHWQDV